MASSAQTGGYAMIGILSAGAVAFAAYICCCKRTRERTLAGPGQEGLRGAEQGLLDVNGPPAGSINGLEAAEAVAAVEAGRGVLRSAPTPPPTPIAPIPPTIDFRSSADQNNSRSPFWNASCYGTGGTEELNVESSVGAPGKGRKPSEFGF